MSSEGNEASPNPKLMIGDDQDFEKAWWRVEVGIWLFLLFFLLCATVGLLGRGPLSSSVAYTADRMVEVRYQRIARYKTPSEMEVVISPDLARGDKISLWVSTELVKRTGMQRVIPQPDHSLPGETGITYIWSAPSRSEPFRIGFDLQPEFSGISRGLLRVDNSHQIEIRSVIFP